MTKFVMVEKGNTYIEPVCHVDLKLTPDRRGHLNRGNYKVNFVYNRNNIIDGRKSKEIGTAEISRDEFKKISNDLINIQKSDKYFRDLAMRSVKKYKVFGDRILISENSMLNFKSDVMREGKKKLGYYTDTIDLTFNGDDGDSSRPPLKVLYKNIDIDEYIDLEDSKAAFSRHVAEGKMSFVNQRGDTVAVVKEGFTRSTDRCEEVIKSILRMKARLYGEIEKRSYDEGRTRAPVARAISDATYTRYFQDANELPYGTLIPDAGVENVQGPEAFSVPFALDAENI